jgi:hypothetical protein
MGQKLLKVGWDVHARSEWYPISYLPSIAGVGLAFLGMEVQFTATTTALHLLFDVQLKYHESFLSCRRVFVVFAIIGATGCLPRDDCYSPLHPPFIAKVYAFPPATLQNFEWLTTWKKNIFSDVKSILLT